MGDKIELSKLSGVSHVFFVSFTVDANYICDMSVH